MFVPTQKKQFQWAGLLGAVIFAAVVMSGCTPDVQPETNATAVPRVELPSDYCPNLTNVYSKDELPAGYTQDYDFDKGIVCVTVEEVEARIAEAKRLHQEEVAQATAKVLSSQSTSEVTAFDISLQAVAYYCNNLDDNSAKATARLVYEANHAPVPPYGGAAADTSFDTVVAVSCGYLEDESEYAPPAESSSQPAVNF